MGKPLAREKHRMDEFLKEALELVKAQASVRVMGEDEIMAMVQKLSKDLRAIDEGETVAESAESDPSEAKKAIKEKTVSCMECGRTFKIITKKHLALHGLTPAEYREKWGYKRNTPLACKALQRERRRNMQEMKLWERRGKKK